MDTYESVYALYEGREITPNVFKNGIFPIKATKGEGLKINKCFKDYHSSCTIKSREHI